MKQIIKYGDSFYNNQTNIIRNFYSQIKFCGFKSIHPEKIKIIKEKALKTKTYTNNKYDKYTNYYKYTRIIEMISTSPKTYGLSEDDEKLLFLMFWIDPSLEMIKIFQEKNNLKEIKDSILDNFGVFDKNLIKIEKYYIKQFYTKEEKIEFNEEIEKRVFK